MKKFKAYYYLTKPGIIRGNTFAVIAGFLLGSSAVIEWWQLFWTILGSGLVIGGGCALNNYIDRDIDKKMERTKKRALVSGVISPISALVFGGLLSLTGFVILYNFTNLLTVYVGLIGFVFYVYIYAYFKRKNEYSTLIGAIPGAIPPVAGYVSATSTVDFGAVSVFLILFLWQLPHFYAISIFRANEYKKAGIPVLSVIRGIQTTKRYIVTFMILYFGASILPYINNQVGKVYMIVMVSVGIYWLVASVSSYSTKNVSKWARSVFGNSLVVLTAFMVAIFLDKLVI